MLNMSMPSHVVVDLKMNSYFYLCQKHNPDKSCIVRFYGIILEIVTKNGIGGVDIIYRN